MIKFDLFHIFQLGASTINYHGPPTYLDVFMVNNMVFMWPKPLFFMVLGARGSYCLPLRLTEEEDSRRQNPFFQPRDTKEHFLCHSVSDIFTIDSWPKPTKYSYKRYEYIIHGWYGCWMCLGFLRHKKF